MQDLLDFVTEDCGDAAADAEKTPVEACDCQQVERQVEERSGWSCGRGVLIPERGSHMALIGMNGGTS